MLIDESALYFGSAAGELVAMRLLAVGILPASERTRSVAVIGAGNAMESTRLQREQNKNEPVAAGAQKARAGPAIGSIPLTFHHARSPFIRLAQTGAFTDKPMCALQTKLTVNQPGDLYEQDAELVAERVMRMTDPALRLQRKCGCGGATSSGESCEACASPSMQLQRRAAPGPDSRIKVPDIVHDVLRSPGHALNHDTRGFFEGRFGQDFSHVRVHTDDRAAKSAQAVNALAYTVGNDVVFGAGQYAPNSYLGQKLLAHELTHVTQNGSEVAGGRQLEVRSPDATFERNTNHALEGKSGGLNSVGETQKLRRWKIEGNLATSEGTEDDRLGLLAQQITKSPLDWKCIRPAKMGTAENIPPGDFDTNYERYVQKGDVFDISNLQGPLSGPTLKLALFGPGENNFIVVSVIYPGISPSKNPDADIASASGQGRTPLWDLVVAGHQAGGRMYGASGEFNLNDKRLDSELPAHTFARAKDAMFPRRCWFARFSGARSVGCASASFGELFAAKYLRKGASIATTLRAIVPACSLPYQNGPHCISIDRIRFDPRPTEETTDEHGPFPLEAAKFHGSAFWKEIRGKL
jgi:hypothetical protein